MNKILITALSIAALCLFGCGDSGSTKPCQRTAFCYKTSDAPNQRKCDLDKAVAEGADAAMLYDTVDEPFGYGRMITDANGMPCNIVEQKELKPEQQAIREVNASVYCFDAKALLWALDFLKSDNAANEYYLTDVIPVLYNAGRKIVGIAAEEHSECMGVNTLDQLKQAEDAMLARRAGK